MMNGVVAIENLKEMKIILKDQLSNLAEGYVSVGFYLKYTRDNELYRQEGYADIYDFAQQAFGVSRTYANRWMNANDKYSIDGNSPEIEDRYRAYGSSQLIEMMNIPEEIAMEIPSQATIKDIREVKQGVRETEHENRQKKDLCDVAQTIENTECGGKSEGVEKALKNILKIWFEDDMKDQFESYYKFTNKVDARADTLGVLAILNPTKFKMVRTGAGNMMMREDAVVLLMGDKPKLSYDYLAGVFKELFWREGQDAAAAYEQIYGKPLKEPEVQEAEPQKPEPQKPEPQKPEPQKPEPQKPEPQKPELEKLVIETPVAAVAEKVVEKEDPVETAREEKTIQEEQLQGQTSIEKDFPQFLPETGEGELVEELEEYDGENKMAAVAVHEITEEVVQEGMKRGDILISGSDSDRIKVMIKAFNCPLNNPGECPYKCNYDMSECAAKRAGCWKDWMEKVVNINE